MSDNRCICQVCRARVDAGLPPLEGVSVSKTMHLLAEELGAPRRAVREKSAVVPAPGLSELIEGIGDALGMVRAELESQAEARALALEAKINMLEAALRTRELVRHLGKPAGLLTDGHRTNH